VAINIAFMAHVDAGKTTLTERILYETGAIRSVGSVDEGTARTDDLAVEKARGISIRAAFTSVEFDGVTVNIIDTPGHADFFSQAERAFWAADAVIVLVSAVDGIQAGTETILAESGDCPVLFFINKCDRETARVSEVVAQIKDLRRGAYLYSACRYETAATLDETLLEAFIRGLPENRDAADSVLREHILSTPPILCGSAKTGEGVPDLLEAVTRLVSGGGEAAGEAAGIIFSVTHDKQFGRGAAVRLYAGTLRTRDTVSIRGAAVKAALIRQRRDDRWEDTDELRAGGIGLVYGFSHCKTGDTFGGQIPARASRGFSAKALMSAKISPADTADNTALKNAMEMLSAEDPALELYYTGGQAHVGVMGLIQMETLPALIQERFGVAVTLGDPEVVYKETPARAAFGFDAYTMPKPCWAVVKFQITPAPRGSGITYRCAAGADRLPYRYREQVAQSVAPSLRQGPLGWEVTDADIELIDGEDHHIHTHPLDFTVATPLALADGLRNSGTILLEPVLDVRFTFHEKHLGKIIGDILRMRGVTESQTYRENGGVTLTARIPLASSMAYPAVFASITSGLGIMTQKLRGYQECPLELGKTRPRRGIDPLDRAKYILAARNALSGTVFDA
jgi:ribosomal protection tetracycline resistance protein